MAIETIDLVQVSENLANLLTFCKTHHIKHRSDHFAIESVFDTPSPSRHNPDGHLLKVAPWDRTKEAVASRSNIPRPAGTQDQCDRLINTVTDVV